MSGAVGALRRPGEPGERVNQQAPLLAILTGAHLGGGADQMFRWSPKLLLATARFAPLFLRAAIQPRNPNRQMTKRVPIISTIIVAAAVALMIWLGIWQLHRAKWKEGLIASYSKAQKLPPITWPTSKLRDDQLPLFSLCDRSLHQAVEQPGDRRGKSRERTGLCLYRLLRDCWRWSRHGGRTRLEPEPQRQIYLGGWSCQRDHCSRSPVADAPCGRVVSCGARSKPTAGHQFDQCDYARDPSGLCCNLVWFGGHCAHHLWIGDCPAKESGASDALSGEMHVLSNGLTIAVDPLSGAGKRCARALRDGWIALRARASQWSCPCR